MRYLPLIALASLATLGGCTAATAPAPASAPATDAVAYAIDNPHRPGAKAPDCTTLAETLDGCTFHNEHGVIQQARLSAAPGETWVATPGDATLLRTRNVAAEQADGTGLQVIELAPTVHGDADATVTFDKVVGPAGARKVIERRRVSVMIHTHG